MRINLRTASRLAILAAILILAACNGVETTAVPTATPTPVPLVITTRTTPALGLGEYGVCKEHGCVDQELEDMMFSQFLGEISRLQVELDQRHSSMLYTNEWYFYTDATRWHSGGTFYTGATQEIKVCPEDLLRGESEDHGAGGGSSHCPDTSMPEEGYITVDWSSGTPVLVDSGFVNR